MIKGEGAHQAGVVGKKVDEDLSVKIVDKYENPVEGVEVRWQFDGFPKDTQNHKIEPNPSVSDKYGMASSSLTYGTRMGVYIVSAYKQGLIGSPVEFSDLKADHNDPYDLVPVSPIHMKKYVRRTVLLEVKLIDRFGNPVDGETIDFTIDENRSPIGGEIKDSKTDAAGKASSSFKIGETTGKYYVDAIYGNLPKVTFEVEGLPNRDSAEIYPITKEGQKGYTDTDLKESLVVEVKDKYENLIEDISVLFEIVEHPAGASSMEVTPATAFTRTNGRAETKLHLGNKVGDYVVQASLTDNPDKFVKFMAEAKSITIGNVRPKELHFGIEENVKKLEFFRERGDEVIEWKITSKSDWIVPQKDSGSFVGDNQAIEIAVDRSILSIGTHEDEIEIKINNKDFSVKVIAEAAFISVPSKLIPLEPSLSSAVCTEVVLRAKLTDDDNNPSEDYTVSFQIVKSPPSVQVKEQLIPSDGKSITDGNGIAKVTLKLGSKAQDKGYEILANYSGGKELYANFVVTAEPAEPYEILKGKGDHQSGVVGKKVDEDLSVKIVDKYDNPVEGVEIRWQFDGFPKDTQNHKIEPNPSVSDKYGVARTSLTYGTVMGVYIVSAYKQGLIGSPVEFTDLKADHDEPDKLIRVSPSFVKDTVGTVTEPLVVKLVDKFGNPVDGKTIDFDFDENRSISIDGEIKDSKTDADGKASSPFKIGKTAGKYYVDAKWGDLPKGTFEVEGLPDPSTAEIFKITKEGQKGYPDTDLKESLVVEVRDPENLLNGISVSFEIVEHPAGASGMSVTPATAFTTNGRAETKLHLGDKVGGYIVQASLTDNPEKFVKFTATADITDGDVRPKELHFGIEDKDKKIEIFRVRGDDAIEWEIIDKSDWIVPEKNSDSFTGDSQTIDIAVNRATLSIGTHEGEIELKINNQEFSVKVTADVAFISRITVINLLYLQPVESASVLWNGEEYITDPNGQVELVITEPVEVISATVSKEYYIDTEFQSLLKEEIVVELKPIPQKIEEISSPEFGELSKAAFSSDESRLYITDKEVESPQLFCINTSDNQITGSYDFPRGSDPVGVAVNPDSKTDEIYVTLSGGLTREDSVIVLNPDLEKIAEIKVGNGPVDLAVTPDGKFLYVLNQIEETVSEVDIDRRVEIKPRIEVGGLPQAIVIRGTYAYVTNADDSSVSVIDLKFRQVETTVHVGSEPHGMALSESGGYLYTANYGGNSISVIGTNSNTREKDIPVGNFPIDLCLGPLDLLLVANYMDGIISIVDLESGKVADETIQLRYVNQAIVSTKDGKKIYVVHPNAVSVLGY